MSRPGTSAATTIAVAGPAAPAALAGVRRVRVKGQPYGAEVSFAQSSAWATHNSA
jgi:hypothetical protein